MIFLPSQALRRTMITASCIAYFTCRYIVNFIWEGEKIENEDVENKESHSIKFNSLILISMIQSH